MTYTPIKPPISYYGGKTSIARQVAALLPDHGHYVEPFAGSLAVLLAKPPAAHETVNDLDGDLVTFWRVLRDRPAELARACALTPHARAEQVAAYQPATDELEQARRVWVLLTQGRSGTLRRTGWRHYVDPRGSRHSMPDYLDSYRGRIAAAAARITRVSLECRPALDVIDTYGRHSDVLLYVDPPYLGSTRKGTNYRREMPRVDQHAELADALRSCRAAVVLSGYPSPDYDRLYAGWHRVDIDTGTGQGGTWAVRTEAVWSNRSLANQPPSLFDLEGVA